MGFAVPTHHSAGAGENENVGESRAPRSLRQDLILADWPLYFRGRNYVFQVVEEGVGDNALIVKLRWNAFEYGVARSPLKPKCGLN